MTVRHGRESLVIPGPTTVPDEVLRAMHRPAVDIFDEDLVETTDSCIAHLKQIFHTAVMFISMLPMVTVPGKALWRMYFHQGMQYLFSTVGGLPKPGERWQI